MLTVVILMISEIPRVILEDQGDVIQMEVLWPPEYIFRLIFSDAFGTTEVPVI